MTENTRKKAKLIQEIVLQHYEQGNQSKSKIQVYRNHVYKLFPICERTFWRYMGIDTSAQEKPIEDKKQLKLDLDL